MVGLIRVLAGLVVGLAGVLPAAGGQTEETNGEKIVVAAFEYPPIYQDGTEGKGLAGDLVVAAFKAAGIDAELRFVPVARMVQNVSAGQVPCGIGGSVLFAAPEVAAKVSVAGVVQYVSQVFYYDQRRYPGGIPFHDLGNLAGYRIGVLHASGIAKFLGQEKRLLFDTNLTHEGSARQLQMGRVDLWAIVDLTGAMYLNQLFPREAGLYRHSRAFNNGDVSLVCSRTLDPAGLYAARFRQGLATIKKNGTYLHIMAKYYGGRDRITPETLPSDLR